MRALTRAATAETEDVLLHIALNGTAAHVERTVRGFRRVQRHRERNEAEVLYERRCLSCRRDADGNVRLEARISPEVGAMLLKALQVADAQLEEQAGDEDVSAETPSTQSALERRRNVSLASVSAETPPRSNSQRRADAFAHILERFLAGKGSGSAAGAHELVVHIAHDALRDVSKSTGASFQNGTPVAVETARRLGCDGVLLGVVKGDKGEPLAVGRRTRAVAARHPAGAAGA